ncbi:hypothetical protein [Methanobacterium aggregans]|uniref:hypothetical protein n=1 Tax=Methanobacterium aggregans TaxID=1615586 RepID=UPI001AE68016|nr:hypothetical protein [Methanobacterium aggregans]MBP2045220.1 Mg2+ and Co2+ transporter CorA [Methanobacterium aggregans]
MNDDIKINKPENKKMKGKINIWGVYISLCFIIAGVLWYAVNLGIIPYQYIQEQLGPIVIVLIGIIILIKSL